MRLRLLFDRLSFAHWLVVRARKISVHTRVTYTCAQFASLLNVKLQRFLVFNTLTSKTFLYSLLFLLFVLLIHSRTRPSSSLIIVRGREVKKTKCVHQVHLLPFRNVLLFSQFYQYKIKSEKFLTFQFLFLPRSSTRRQHACLRKKRLLDVLVWSFNWAKVISATMFRSVNHRAVRIA